MIVWIVFICILLSFLIWITLYLDRKGSKTLIVEEKLTDDVQVLFEENSEAKEDKNEKKIRR